MPKKFRATSWIVTVPIAAGALAYLWLYFVPCMRAVGQIMEEVRTKQMFVASSSKLTDSIQLAQQQVEAAQRYADKQRQRMLDEPQLTTFFARVNHLAKRSGTTTTRFEPQAPVEYGTLAKLPVAFTVAGSFAGIEQLLRELELLPSTVWVEDLKIETAGEDGQTVKCDATLAIFINRSKKSD